MVERHRRVMIYKDVDRTESAGFQSNAGACGLSK
jgi:hypothetical protein